MKRKSVRVLALKNTQKRHIIFSSNSDNRGVGGRLTEIEKLKGTARYSFQFDHHNTIKPIERIQDSKLPANKTSRESPSCEKIILLPQI